MQQPRRKNGTSRRRLQTVSAVVGSPPQDDEDDLDPRNALARYSHNTTSTNRADITKAQEARAVHRAVLVAIGTPSERSISLGGDDHSTFSGSTSSESSESDDDSHTSSTQTSVDDEEEESSLDGDEEPASPSGADEGLDDDDDATLDVTLNRVQSREETLDDILGTPTNNTLSRPRGSVGGGIFTLGEQTTHHDSILRRGEIRHAEDSPNSLFQKAMSSGGPQSGTSPTPGSTGSSARSPPPAATPTTTSSKAQLDSARRASLSMIQHLQQSRTPLHIDPASTLGSSVGTSFASPLSQMDFKKGEELGRGGYGVVFRAVLPTGQLAAVKQLPATDQKGIDKEMRVMCNLPPHPNCVQYLGTRKTKHHVYMVMEFVSGGSVHALRKTFGKLSENVARRYAHMTLLGLHHLHTHRIIHQDIKGGNVLLDERGIAKIADFGCIRELSYSTTNNATISGNSQGGAGTPLWMAPEVCRGERASTRSDVWSFGCFVLEMINDSGLPWSFPAGTSLQGAGYAIGSASQPPPIPKHLSKECADFLLACLAVNQRGRSTVEELLRMPFLTAGVVVERTPLFIPAAEDFLKTVQSLTSEPSRQHTEDEPFLLEAASDSEDDGDENGMELPPAVQHPLQGITTARRAVDHGQVVWKSAGEMRVSRHELS